MARIIALVVPIKLSLAPIKLAIPSSTGKKAITTEREINLLDQLFMQNYTQII